MNSLVVEPVPRVLLAVLEWGVPILLPLLEKDDRAILFSEIGGQGGLKASPEDHGGPGIFLPPAIEVAVAVASWAAQILGELCIAIGHGCSPVSPSRGWIQRKVPPIQRPERRLRGSGRSGRSG